MDDPSTVSSPTLELSTIGQLPEDTTCLACSGDGRYLCLGHSRGLSVWCASSCECVAEWEQDGLGISTLQVTGVAESIYLLGAVDDMGVPRVFALHSEAVHLLCVLNVMEEINKRSICLTFEIFEGGHCAAASFSCNGDSWLEVFQFPLATWLKDLEMKRSPKQDSNSSEGMDVTWSPVTLLMKIQPPRAAEGPMTEDKGVESPLDYCPTSDFSSHWLALDEIRSSGLQQERTSHSSSSGAKETNTSPRCCTQHFLLSCSRSQIDGKSGLPVAIGVWWSGSHNFLHYLLQKEKSPKKDQNVEPVPDVVWPNQYRILCSAVSPSTRYVALGLEEALVCIWDRKLGAPLSIFTIPKVSSAFFRMLFVDCGHVTAHVFQSTRAQEVHLAVLCKGGLVYTVTTGRGIKPSTVPLDNRLKHSRDIPVAMTPIPFLKGLIFVVHMTGKMFLHDVITRKTVCFMAPPSTHVITFTPSNPVYTLSNNQQALFIRGDQDITGRGSTESQSLLFALRFGENGIFKEYVGSSS